MRVMYLMSEMKEGKDENEVSSSSNNQLLTHNQDLIFGISKEQEDRISEIDNLLEEYGTISTMFEAAEKDMRRSRERVGRKGISSDPFLVSSSSSSSRPTSSNNQQKRRDYLRENREKVEVERKKKELDHSLQTLKEIDFLDDVLILDQKDLISMNNSTTMNHSPRSPSKRKNSPNAAIINDYSSSRNSLMSVPTSSSLVTSCLGKRVSRRDLDTLIKEVQSNQHRDGSNDNNLLINQLDQKEKREEEEKLNDLLKSIYPLVEKVGDVKEKRRRGVVDELTHNNNNINRRRRETDILDNDLQERIKDEIEMRSSPPTTPYYLHDDPSSGKFSSKLMEEESKQQNQLEEEEDEDEMFFKEQEEERQVEEKEDRQDTISSMYYVVDETHDKVREALRLAEHSLSQVLIHNRNLEEEEELHVESEEVNHEEEDEEEEDFYENFY